MPVDDAYTRLAHAIVVLAAKDYDAELDWFRQNPPRDEEDKQHETYLKHQQLQRTERVAFHLGIILSGDEDSKPMLVVNHVHGAVRDKDGIRCAESILDPAREVHPLLDEHHRVGAGLLGGLQQLKDICGISGSTVVHLLIEPGQVLSRVGGLHAQRLPELVLTKRMSVGALGGII